MQASRLLLCALCAVSARALVVEEHPIAGVLTLLGQLQETAKEEGVTDTGNYNAFARWCSGSVATLDTAVKREKNEIDRLEDKITGLKDEIEVLDHNIKYLGEQIEEQNGAAAKATKIRNTAEALYGDEQDNLHDTVDAVEDATSAMQDSGASLLTKKALMSKVAALAGHRMDAKQHAQVKKYLSLLQTAEPSYDFKSGDIIETFKGMVTDFELQTTESVESETKAKNDFNRAKTARDAAISAAQDAKGTKETAVSDKRSRKAQADSDLSAEKKALVADSTTLDNTHKDCTDMKNQFEERTKSRNEEIQALAMAAKILEKVTGVRNPDTHEAPTKAGLVQKKLVVERPKTALRGVFFDYGGGDDSAMGFLQVGHKHHHHHHHHSHHAHTHNGHHDQAVAKDAKSVRGRVAAMLRQASGLKHASSAKAISQLAASVESSEGQFDKIIQMVQKMIFHLMSEQKEEDDNKNWCDLETQKSTEKKEDRTSKIRAFTLKLESLSALVQTLTGEIAASQTKIKDINKYSAEETELREENHKECQATIKDAAAGKAALANAIEVLTKFYKKSGMIAKEPWEFVQVGGQAPGDTVSLGDKPSTWDSSYSGVTDPENGDNAVLTLLEGTKTKFATMEATTKANDQNDQKNFESDMQAQKIELEETKTEETMQAERKSRIEEKIEGMTEGKKHLAREKDAVVAYLKDLETPCAVGGDSYEDRKDARTQELEAMREAQNILVEANKEKK